jgi:hypothetical protein
MCQQEGVTRAGQENVRGNNSNDLGMGTFTQLLLWETKYFIHKPVFVSVFLNFIQLQTKKYDP